MIRKIVITDTGSDRYTVASSNLILGRMYEDNAEELAVYVPKCELDNECFMIVTAKNKPLMYKRINHGESFKIEGNITKFNKIYIGFTFKNTSKNYVKNSEIKEFTFLPAQNPDIDVDVDEEIKQSVIKVAAKAVSDIELIGDELVFKNVSGEKVKSINISGLSGASGSLDGVIKNIKLNNQQLDVVDGSVNIDLSDYISKSNNTMTESINYNAGVGVKLNTTNKKYLIYGDATGTDDVYMAIANNGSSAYYYKFIDSNGKLYSDNKKVVVYDEISNPNLLINGDFRVNQRNFTSYEGRGTNIIKYIVDRWKAVFTTTRHGKIEVNSNGGIDFTCYSTAPSFRQDLERKDFEKLLGKTVTLSIKVSSIVGNSPLMVWLRDSGNWSNIKRINITNAGTHSFTATIPDNITGSLVVYISYDNYVNDTTSSIDWVKLEIGSVATAFSPKPYNEELSACQMPFEDVGISTTYNNPNLLINGDFRINQRGQISYSRIKNDNFYSLDRWRVYSPVSVGGTITKTDVGVQISGENQGTNFFQTLEIDFNKLLNKTVTASAKVNENIYRITATLPSTLPTAYDTNYKTLEMFDGNFLRIEIRILEGIPYLSCGIWHKTGVLNVEWIKLEFGNISTEFNPKSYIEELENCQRYYQKLHINGITTFVSNVNTGYSGIPLICSMRAKPILTVTSMPQYRGEKSYGGNPKSIITNLLYDNLLQIQIDTTNLNLVNLGSYILVNGEITADAEIY